MLIRAVSYGASLPGRQTDTHLLAPRARRGAIPYQQFLNRVEPGTRPGTFQRVILRRAGVVAMDAATIDRQFPAHIDSTFTPQAISAMSHALQGVCETL